MTELLKQEEKTIFALRELYQRYGYSQFKMSKFESYELYMQNKDFLVSEGVITFTDTDGTLMALKPDVTLSIVKNYRKESAAIQKVYYSENVYRTAGAGQSYREIMQTGLECLGDIGFYEICEVILLAARSLQTISEHFVLDISHLQIVTDLIAELRYDRQTQVLQAIADKNQDALAIDQAGYAQLQTLLRTSGPINAVLPQLTALCNTDSSKTALEQLRTICQLMQQYGLEDHINLDFSIVNDMNYYNGIVFRGYVEGIPASILSGGQYDKLMKKMDKDACAIGFAVYLDQLERLDHRCSVYDVDTVLLHKQTDDVLQLSAYAEELTKDGSSILLLSHLPETLRYRRLVQYEDGRLTVLENNG